MLPSSEPDASDSDTIAVELKDVQRLGIYDVRSERKRNVILLVAAIVSVLLPFSDTIYLPALKAMEGDLQTSATLTAASVAIYLLAVGLASLVWGPFSDYYGRSRTYWVSMAGFLAATLVCIWAPNIAVLITFRALQGCFIASALTIGNAVVADIFPPEHRGTASGVFLVPLLVGPILGPLVGGGISQAFGWRATFITLAILGLAMLLLLVAGFTETHPFYVLATLRKADPAAAASIEDASGPIPQPVFQPPWRALAFMIEPAIGWHAAVSFVTFAVFFATLVELPLVVSEPPYSLSQALIGVAYLANGIGSLLATPAGGKLADVADSLYGSKCQEARLLPNTAVNMVMMPAALLAFGWSFHYTTHLAVPLVAHFFIGVSASQYLPSIYSYLTIAKQQEAGAAGAMVQSLEFVAAAVFAEVSAVIVGAIGIGQFFSIMAAVSFVVSAAALARVVQQLHGGPCTASTVGAAAGADARAVGVA